MCEEQECGMKAHSARVGLEQAATALAGSFVLPLALWP